MTSDDEGLGPLPSCLPGAARLIVVWLAHTAGFLVAAFSILYAMVGLNFVSNVRHGDMDPGLAAWLGLLVVLLSPFVGIVTTSISCTFTDVDRRYRARVYGITWLIIVVGLMLWFGGCGMYGPHP